MSVGRRLYVRAGRFVAPAALITLKLYTLVTGRPRVRVVAVNEYDEVLLVRGVISHTGWWTLPGGGVNRREGLVAAAKRELYEETGIVCQESALIYLRTVAKHELRLGFRAPLFHVTVKRDELPERPFNPLEIAAISWFPLDKLPPETVALVPLAIGEYKRILGR